MTGTNFLLLVLFNLSFWFFLMPFLTSMSYGVGFVGFASILFLRFLANLYVNWRDFTPAQYYAFPYRIP